MVCVEVNSDGLVVWGFVVADVLALDSSDDVALWGQKVGGKLGVDCATCAALSVLM